MSTTTNTLCAEQPAATEVPGPSGAEAPTAPPVSGTSGDHPVLDLQSLRDIAEDTGGPALALQFLTDFFSLQQARLSRLLAALAAEDHPASIDAVLRLQTAAAMAGATEIAKPCAIILSLIAARNFASAQVQSGVLQRDVGVQTVDSPMLLERAKAVLGMPSTLPTLRPAEVACCQNR